MHRGLLIIFLLLPIWGHCQLDRAKVYNFIFKQDSLLIFENRFSCTYSYLTRYTVKWGMDSVYIQKSTKPERNPASITKYPVRKLRRRYRNWWYIANKEVNIYGLAEEGEKHATFTQHEGVRLPKSCMVDILDFLFSKGMKPGRHNPYEGGYYIMEGWGISEAFRTREPLIGEYLSGLIDGEELD